MPHTMSENDFSKLVVIKTWCQSAVLSSGATLAESLRPEAPAHRLMQQNEGAHLCMVAVHQKQRPGQSLDPVWLN